MKFVKGEFYKITIPNGYSFVAQYLRTRTHNHVFSNGILVGVRNDYYIVTELTPLEKALL
jgi:hypothetical protein